MKNTISNEKNRSVVVIMVDTQRKDMLGCYGNPDMCTPNLDTMAEEGILFYSAYCCQPVCGPARSALFTGTYPHSNGVWGNSMPLGKTVKTVGKRLKDRGVHTGYIGKWHLDGGDYFGMGHSPEGWDPEYWYDMRNYLEEMTPEERKESRSHFKSLDPEVTPDFTFAHKCSNRVVDFLETYGDKEDFLLVVSYDEPHGPSITPSEYYERFANYKFPVPRNVKDTLENKPEHQKVWAGAAQNKNRENIKIQNPNLFACNSFVDSEIGRVLDAIDEFAPETLVIYTSDHGTMLKSHCLDGKGPAMYDEITNIPFIIKWKGHAPKGIKSKALLSHIDLTPSILDYFGVNSPPLLEGESKLNLFQSEAALLEPTKEENQLLTNSEVFMEFGRYEIDHDGFGGFQPIRAVRNKRFKLVINLLSSDELYDLKEDPGEMKNLIGSETHAEIRNELHDRLLKWMNKTRDPFRGYYWERRPWRKDAADATWDYTGMTRQRVEDEIYEPTQLDYNTGMPIKKPTRKK